jgi:hypothetical protein
MGNVRCLAVHNLPGPFDLSAVDGINALPGDVNREPFALTEDLLSKAHTQNGDLASEVFDGCVADARVTIGMARTRADDQMGRLDGNKLVEGDLVIPEDGDGSALQDQVLVHIPSEAIIIVNHDHPRGRGQRRARHRLVGRVVHELRLRHDETSYQGGCISTQLEASLESIEEWESSSSNDSSDGGSATGHSKRHMRQLPRSRRNH